MVKKSNKVAVFDFDGGLADDWIPDDYHGAVGGYRGSQSKDFRGCAVSYPEDGL